MDVLSEVLKVVRLQGALFYNTEFSLSWSVYAAPSHGLARYFATNTEQVIVYHSLTEGHATVRLENGGRLQLLPVDIVMIPHGDKHIVENGSTARNDASGRWLENSIRFSVDQRNAERVIKLQETISTGESRKSWPLRIYTSCATRFG